MNQKSSRQLAGTWPFKRYSAFVNELREAASNWFEKRGFLPHSKLNYCLDKYESWPKNIICKDVGEYIQNEKALAKGEKPFPLHKYIHHGLSSQAMVFNLVGPLIIRKDLSPLKTALLQSGIQWPSGKVTARFEYEDRCVFNEDSGQPTSIDLLIEGSSSNLFIEAKLSEREFGGCSVFGTGDCEGMNPCQVGFSYCYLHHIGRLYWDQLQKHGFITPPFSTSPICPLANYYQFFREALFAIHNGGKFVLLYDERNPAFLRTSNDDGQIYGLWPFLKTFIPKQHEKSISSVTIQQIVKFIEVSGNHDDWVHQFKEKYGIN